MRRRLLAFVLTMALVLMLFPAAAFAADVNIDISADDVEITAGDGNNYIITGTGVYHSITVTGTGVANITLNDVNILHEINPFKIESGVYVNLTLTGDSTLLNDDEGACINVPEGAELKITSASTGSLTVSGADDSAGIGGNQNEDAGTIIIEGGEVEAQGGSGGAGIGGGSFGDGGTISILGDAQVTAVGGNNAAGIGGGYEGSGGTISISGSAQVNATCSNESGAGIGGGYSGNAGTINISGGTVLAQGGEYAAGLGAGSFGYSGEINISGGNVAAEGGGNGSGIGSGEIGINENICAVNISGGTVTATAGWSAAGIGGGQMGSGGSVSISGGRVTALTSNGGSGAGIGGGSGGENGGTVTISGGTVIASGGADGGAGIGGGADGDGANVIITGGSVKAVKGNDDAMDVGYGKDGSSLGTLTDGADDVFLTIVTLDILSNNKLVTFLTSAPGYGINDMYTDDSGKLYLYLPNSTSTTQAVAVAHTYSGEIITEDDEDPTEGTLYRENVNPSVNTLDITIAEVGQTATFVLNFGSGSLQADSFVLGPRDTDIASALPDSGDVSAPMTITVTALAEGTTIIDVITFRSSFTHTMFQINITVGTLGGLDPIPHTGDSSGDKFIWWLLLGVSALGISALVILRKRLCQK